MKKFITIFCIVASLLLILDSLNFGYALMTFLFAGIVPGVNIQLSPEEMSVLFTVSVILVVIWLKPQLLQKINSIIAKQDHSKPRKLKHV